MLSRLKKKPSKKDVSLIILGSVILFSGIKYIISRVKANRILRQGKEKLASKLATRLPIEIEKCEISKSLESFILSLKAFEIVENIKTSKITAEQVLAVYVSRCRHLGCLYHLSAEELFVDAYSRLPSLPSGPLEGVPISIKDEIFQEKCHSSGGVVRLSQIADPGDSVLVSLLRGSGAVPFVRGNAMQLMMWFETVNNVYGRAENPWDPLRSPGGSSGGDAGLVAAGATPLAIGSDIAGSIRIPAAFCGIYGFKPSSRRVSYAECVSTHPNAVLPLEIMVRASYGPLGKCVDDLALVLRTWWVEEMWKRDTIAVPLKFNEFEYSENKKKLRVGYYDFNQVFECAEVVKKIVGNTVKFLESEGHEIIKISTDMVPKALELFIKATYGSDPTFMLDELQGEDPAWCYARTWYSANYPFMGKVVNWYKYVTGYKELYKYMSMSRKITYKEFSQLVYEIQCFKFEFNQYWQSLNLDVVVCPIWPLVAPLHQSTVKIAHAFSYSCLWNLLDYPAGVVPVKLVENGENCYNVKGDKSIEVAKEIMKDSVGLPVCVQVVGRTFEDEKVLRVMKIIEDHYQFYQLAKTQ